nr:MAG TPA: hypothetical protein [Caudoviricetes sp.]
MRTYEILQRIRRKGALSAQYKRAYRKDAQY